MPQIDVREETFPGHGGLSLFARSWRPTEKPRGVVVLMHGFLAHSGLYRWTAEQLVKGGYAAYAFDMRGHGQSDGDRYWVDQFSDYVADLGHFVDLVQSREPGLPLFLLGHSAGGVVVTVYAQQHGDRLAGLVSESFAFEVPPPEFILQALKGVAALFPHAPILTLKPADFSRDPQVVEAITNDPLINHLPGPAHTLAELVRAHDHLGESFAQVTAPLLIVHGTADKATRPHGSQRFFDEAGSTDKTLKLYEGHVHDLLNDVGKEQVLADIRGWIEARTPAR
jgi:acylglycerol lipase